MFVVPAGVVIVAPPAVYTLNLLLPIRDKRPAEKLNYPT